MRPSNPPVSRPSLAASAQRPLLESAPSPDPPPVVLPSGRRDESGVAFDALLLVSFGGPEGPEDVMPFLRNVTRGRAIPEERLAEVAEHYLRFGGRSPINEQNRDFLAAVRADLAEHGLDLPVYWGNRNWRPYLADAVRQMRADGVRRVACFVTSAYASYSGCRQYREDLHDAAVDAGGAPALDKLRHYFNHPGFLAAFVDATGEALARLPQERARSARLVFVTHSIPTEMALSSGPDGNAYVDQHRAVAATVAAGVADRTGSSREWDLVYCSRSGPPAVPWLEPDVNDHLRALAGAGTDAVVVVPIGFVSDHMEVVYDLDTEAAETAAQLSMAFERAATPGTHPAFVAVVRDLLRERSARIAGTHVEPRAVGPLSPAWDVCPASCCPNPRGDRPALCQSAP